MDEALLKLQDGGVVLLLGFSTVFIFLTILIFAMQIQAVVIGYLNKIFPVAAPQTAPSKAVKSSDEEEIAIAIACATLKENHG